MVHPRTFLRIILELFGEVLIIFGAVKIAYFSTFPNRPPIFDFLLILGYIFVGVTLRILSDKISIKANNFIDKKVNNVSKKARKRA